MNTPRLLAKCYRTGLSLPVGRNMCISVLSHNLPGFCEINRAEPSSGPLEKASGDFSDIAPFFPKCYNLAAYVNCSQTLQSLVQLQVNLSKVEKKPHVARKILNRDFEKDIKSHIFFLHDFVEADDLGIYLTKNPEILCEELDSLKVRVNYMKSKKFSNLQIKRIVSKNPFWLTFSTVRIDRRLGYFQEKFFLTGDEVRYLTTKQPKLITYNLHHIKTNTFALKEEMGFQDNEIKQLILNKPKLLMTSQVHLLRKFNYIHNVIKISHEAVLRNPEVLLCREFKVKQRHTFLQKLGRAQYDPKKENFVPVKALVVGTDSEFCISYAKCNVNDFNAHLKTM